MMFLKVLLYAMAWLSSVLAARAAADDVYVRVSQVGYRPADVKIAIAMGRAALPRKFQVIDVATQKTLFEGEPRGIDGAWGEFSHHAELNFSKFDRDGEYLL